MLRFFFFSYYKYFNVNLMLDFFLKKIIEISLKNIFIYTAQFFAEKFFIEYITKKSIELYIFINNRINIFFFFSILYFFLYFFIFLNIFLIFFNFFLILS